MPRHDTVDPMLHTYIHIHTHVTTIGAFVSLQAMIPPGCSEGLDVFGFFL